MCVRITRPWQLRTWPVAHLDAGQVFPVSTSLAVYLLAMGCAEAVNSSPDDLQQGPKPGAEAST